VIISVFEAVATCYYQSNHLKVEAIPLSALPKDTSELVGPTTGGDRVIGPLGVVVSLFRPTSPERGAERTTTLRRRDVGAGGNGIPGNERALGQTRSPNRSNTPLYSCSLPSAHWHQPLQRLDTLATLCGDEIFLITPFPVRFLRFPQGNWPLPGLIRCELCRLRCHGHSLLLSSYLCRMK